MPGLSFLSKKSWHTTNIKNVEKVWLAEQKAEGEQKKLAELQKQLQEERQIQELRQLQAASGQSVKTVDNSMDWMYEGPASSARVQQNSEEYLLGKIYKPQENKTFDLSVPVQLDGKKDAAWMSKVSHKNDIFSRMHEDPMVMIKQAEKKQIDAVVNNPIKMERIRQTLEKELEQEVFRKEQKKKAKKEKKEKKKDKHKKHRNKHSSDSENDSEVSREKEKSKFRAYSEDSDDDSRRHHDTRRRDERERSRDDHHRDRNDRHNRSRSRSRSDSRDHKRRRRSESRDNNKDKRYGLQGNTSHAQKDFLGPRPDLLKKKDEEDRALQRERDLKRKESSRPLTAEEKAQRLAEMQNNASVNDATRLSRITQHSNSHTSQTTSHDNDQNTGNADFIRSMRSEIYQNASEKGIKERLDQHRHYHQRSNEIESSSSFLKR